MMTPGPVEPPAPPVLPGYLGYLLRRAYAITRGQVQAMIPTPHGPRELAVLATLTDQAPMSQQQLGIVAHVNRTIMVKLVDKLESHGLVTRDRNPADRRSYALALTPKGLAMLRTLVPVADRFEARLTANLTDVEGDRLKRLLRLLVVDADQPSPRWLNEFTAYLVSRAHARVRAASTQALAPLHLLPRQFGALVVVSEDQPCTQQHLAARLGVSAPMALQVIDEAERLGLVTRTRNAADRRAYDLTLTPLGEERLHAAHRALTSVGKLLRDVLGDDGEQELCRLLRRLLAIPEPTPQPPSPEPAHPPQIR